VSLDRSLIGTASESVTFDIEKGAAVKLAEAIGDPHPAYVAGTAVPPTFPTTFHFRVRHPALEEIDPARFIHGEQEFEYERPLRPGDRVTCATRITDLNEKETRLGTAYFVTVETEGRDDGGDLVFTSRSTLIVR
jgi:hydroxyacyl-ACP dehydratase HTD2-like protein with hotdog domain